MSEQGKGARMPLRHLERVAEIAAQRYLDNFIFRAAIQAIPHIGGPLDTLIAGMGSTVVRKRQELFLEHLKAKMAELEARKIDMDFVESEDFLHLFLKAFDYATRATRKQRIELIAQALAGAVTEDPGKGLRDDVEEILEITASLTLDEARFLRELVAAYFEALSLKAHDTDKKNVLQMFNRSCLAKIVSEANEELLINLARKGLIKEIIGTYLDYTGGAYLPTVVGCKVVSMLTMRSYNYRSF